MQISLFGSRLVLPNSGTLGCSCGEELATEGPFVAVRAAALSYSTKYAITREDTGLCSVQGLHRSFLSSCLYLCGGRRRG